MDPKDSSIERDCTVAHTLWLLYFSARKGSHQLQALKPEARMAIINRLADLLIERKSDILAANQKDLRLGHKNGRTIMQ